MTLNGKALSEGNIVVSEVVCPETTTTYLLKAITGSGQVISQSVSLTVIPSTPTSVPNNGSTLAAATGGCQFALTNLGTTSSEACRFSPDGRWVAAPAADGSLWIIDVAGQTFDKALDPVGRFVVSGNLLWSPNGEFLAFSTTGVDGSGSGVGILRPSSRSLSYLGPDALQGKADTASLPRWTQDGRLIATWHLDDADGFCCRQPVWPACVCPRWPYSPGAGDRIESKCRKCRAAVFSLAAGARMAGRRESVV